MSIKSILKDFVPPFFVKNISGLFYGWSGNYSSWNEAVENSSGYDTGLILEKVKSALLKVKNREAVYERDSVIFDKIHYSFPLLAALSQAAMNNNGKLNVLDFGGSLGSSYFQNRNFFNTLAEFNWCIVEQAHFVKEGKLTFTDEHLQFFYDIPSCTACFKINILILCSVIQYLEDPVSFLKTLIENGFEYVFIDRTPVLLKGNDRITIQKVPENIYKAKYPCWFLNQQKILDCFSGKYDLVFEGREDASINISNAELKYFLFRLKKLN